MGKIYREKFKKKLKFVVDLHETINVSAAKGEKLFPHNVYVYELKLTHPVENMIKNSGLFDQVSGYLEDKKSKDISVNIKEDNPSGLIAFIGVEDGSIIRDITEDISELIKDFDDFSYISKIEV